MKTPLYWMFYARLVWHIWRARRATNRPVSFSGARRLADDMLNDELNKR